MERDRGSAEPGLGALHVSQARASYPSLQTRFAQHKVNLEMNQKQSRTQTIGLTN